MHMQEVADLKENDFTSHVATTATTLSTTVSDDLSKSLSECFAYKKPM